MLVPAEPFELLEPVVDELRAGPPSRSSRSAEAARFAQSRHAASGPTAAEIDAFEAAARLFSFTGETPIQSADRGRRAPERPTRPSRPAHVASRRNRGASFKRVTATSFSVGVMGIVGLLTVGMTMPADAVAAPEAPT